MRKLIFAVLLGLSLSAGQALPGRTGHNAIETHEAMVGWVNPAMLAISDTIEAARGSAEDMDPTSIDPAFWTKLQAAARSLEYGSRRMARARVLRVGDHTAEAPGFANKAEIQAKLDAEPNRFRALAQEMANRAAELKTAASTQDRRRILDRANAVNSSCQACHTLYWDKPHS